MNVLGSVCPPLSITPYPWHIFTSLYNAVRIAGFAIGERKVADTKRLDAEADLSAWLADGANNGHVVQTQLEASDRVIARVTDGIYREPASALRELISNAWDADATAVNILTDAPRFSRIYVRDNGRGMGHETLTRLLKNIGGSAKRRDEGAELGITSATDPDRTPGGRPLIGKIGIGLFSISQLSRRFQIITKVAGENYRLIAEIKLRTYADNAPASSIPDDNDTYVTGTVLIRREHSDDLTAHGTDIILDDVKPLVRNILRSADRWEGVIAKDAAWEAQDLEAWSNMRAERPVFHSGYIGNVVNASGAPTMLSIEARLPWDREDPADIRMSKLMDAVEGEFSRIDRPDLASTLDTYLNMIWSLGLSAPVAYVGKHPFDLTHADNIKLYWISGDKGRGQEVTLGGNVTVRDAIAYQVAGSPSLDAGSDPLGRFTVNIDGLDLKRPIRFKHQQADARSLDRAVLFVGKYAPDLSRIPTMLRGGNLVLDGYLFWTGRVVPKENNGVLVRIRGASGALFDPTFFKYQVSEQTRLRQITSELFVTEGLDAALNIDRESFNFAHPHLQLVTLWLHGAIRQLTNRLKDEAAKLRASRRDEEAEADRTAIQQQVAQVWQRRKGGAPIPRFVMASTLDLVSRARDEGAIAFLTEASLPSPPVARATAVEGQLAALAQVLAAYDVFEGRTYAEQQEMMEAIIAVVGGGL